MSTRIFCRLSRTALIVIISALCAMLLVTGATARHRDRDKVSISVVVRPNGYVPPVYHHGYYHYAAVPVVRPLNYGHWAFRDYSPAFNHRSAYFYFGLFPYVEVARIHVAPYLTVGYVGAPVFFHGGDYYLAKNSSKDTPVSGTLADIRKAWLDGRTDLIKSHVDGKRQIAVLLDGKYDYSVGGTDYISMTTDAIGQLHTASFTWDQVRKRSNGDYSAFGKHVYTDTSGQEKTVYVSYTLTPVRHNFLIVEAGSSQTPLR